jgi:hypothetical protein
LSWFPANPVNLEGIIVAEEISAAQQVAVLTRLFIKVSVVAHQYAIQSIL